jgi:hypothetical protein
MLKRGFTKRPFWSVLFLTLSVSIIMVSTAHAHLSGIGETIFNGSCTSGNAKDPVNLVFTNWGDTPGVINHFEQHVPWGSAGGVTMKFQWHSTQCMDHDWQKATAPSWTSPRSHYRNRHTADQTQVYNWWSLGAAHRDVCAPHIGTRFGPIRDDIRDWFEDQPNHFITTQVWDNDIDVNPGCFSGYTAGAGEVRFITVPSSFH